jgi:group I intron endonuclease
MEKFVDYQLQRSIKHCAAYVITHVKTGRMYVGSSGHVTQRVERHKSLLKLGIHPSSEFQAAYNDDPEITVKMHLTFDRDEAYDYEQEILDQYLPLGKLFNKQPDARQAGGGVSPTQETRDKISAANKGLERSLVTRERIRQVKLGVPRSEEMREFLRRRQTGKVLSEETRRKMSDAHRGVKKPPRQAEHVEKLRLARLGSRHSRESIEAIRAAAKNSRSVVVEGISFRSISEAARYHGIDHKTVRWRLGSVNYPEWQYTQ